MGSQVPEMLKAFNCGNESSGSNLLRKIPACVGSAKEEFYKLPHWDRLVRQISLCFHMYTDSSIYPYFRYRARCTAARDDRRRGAKHQT